MKPQTTGLINRETTKHDVDKWMEDFFARIQLRIMHFHQFPLACDPVEIADQQHAAYAGWLNLSKNPAAIEARIASFDISRRRWDEQIEPLIWALGTLLLVPGLSTNAGRYPHGGTLPLGVLSLVLFFWDGRRIWGWRLEMLPDRLRVRRGFCWSTIPWEQILTVESVGRGNQERVVVKLTSHSEYLGTFNCAFARNLRDRLRIEIAERQGKAILGRFIPRHAITRATLGADSI